MNLYRNAINQQWTETDSSGNLLWNWCWLLIVENKFHLDKYKMDNILSENTAELRNTSQDKLD